MSKGAVLISGAAGGIGSATVDRFLASGYAVAGVDISPAVETLRAGAYRGKVADVTDPAGLAPAVEELLAGRELRHVVSLAGAVVESEKALLNERDSVAATEGFAESIALNLISQFSFVHAALPLLDRSEGNRSIALCSSINAQRGFGNPAYSAAKAGLVGLMHTLATPLGRQGIRINVVAPGTTHTALLEREMGTDGDPNRLERAARGIPLGRVGEPEDIAAVIESLADRTTFVTDEVIRVDGGQTLAGPSGPATGPVHRWRRAVRRRLHNRPFR